MKKLLVIALVVAVTLIGASSAMATIKNSKHDLSSTSTGSIHTTGTSVSACQFCHTPHLGVWSALSGVPLWNRTIGSGYTASGGGAIIVYGALATGNTGTTYSTSIVNTPGPNSRTCLSCHDGTLAMSSIHTGDNSGITGWGGANAGHQTGGVLTSGSALIGLNLNNSHPVGVVYNSTLATTKAGLTASMVDSGSFATIASAWRIYGGADGVGSVECGSCHDPHSNDSAVGGVNSPFLKGSKVNICTDCHAAK